MISATKLTPELEAKAKEELHETPESREKAIKYLNHLIVSETSLHFPKDSDFLVRFLRWSKWDYKKAFEKIQRYYKARKTYSKDYQKIRPSLLKDFYKNYNFRCILPKTDKNGRTVIFNQSNLPFETIDIDEFLADAVLLAERVLDDPANQIKGVVVINDLAGMASKHLTILTPSILYKASDMLYNALPIRVKQIHIMNAPAFYQTALTMFQAYIPDKIKKRIIVHKDLDSLQKYFDLDAIPKEIGGNLQLDYEETSKKMLDWEPTWDVISKYGIK